jgi:tagaturonate reductase
MNKTATKRLQFGKMGLLYKTYFYFSYFKLNFILILNEIKIKQIRLNKKYLTSGNFSANNISVGPIESLPEKVIQFGEGNFLRAFVDWQFNELNKKGLFNGKIVVVQPLPDGMIKTINEQDGLYTLLLRGLNRGKPIEMTEIITSISRGINPYIDWKGFLKCAANNDLRYVVSNTTEAGITYNKESFAHDECPSTFPAKITAFLYERFKLFNGKPGKGMIFLPCELINNNGNTLKEYVIKHAEDWDLGAEFNNWIEKENYFCNTLVDRIVPGYPKDEIDNITEKLGYEDKIIVAAEIFHLWVIQGNKNIRDEIPFAEAGLNVVWTNDIQPYRTLKVRILNGAHTTLTIPSFLSGNDTVKESVEDSIIGKYIKEGIFNEILPVLNFPEKMKDEYAKNTLERFQNPFIYHYLISISLNSVSKYKVRVLPTVLEYYKTYKRLPEVLIFSLAALIIFYKHQKSNNDEIKLREHRLNDDQEVINFFSDLRNEYNYEEVVKLTLSNVKFWDTDLNQIEGITEKVTGYYHSISIQGMRNAIMQLIKK